MTTVESNRGSDESVQLVRGRAPANSDHSSEFHVSNILRRAHAPSMKKLIAEMAQQTLA